jgi:glucose/arabinose dehydrogenase
MRRITMLFVLAGVSVSLPRCYAQLTHGKPPVLPTPYTKPIVANPPRIHVTPGFTPKAPQGFAVSVFAKGFREPRCLAIAPNGDVFVSDSGQGKLFVLKDTGHASTLGQRSVFAEGLKQPYGIAFHNDYVYIGDTNEVLRFHYDPKTSRRTGEREHVMDLPGGGAHWTRTLLFSRDGSQLYISVGSSTNYNIESDNRRAAILISDPEGKNVSIFASGLRNPVGIAFNPESDQLWADVNERDMLGDNLPPDYFTHVVRGGFYGWPYSYIGKNVDDRVKPQRPDLVAKAIVPDVLLGPHVAPLESAFYTAKQFPKSYWDGAFIAEHGSWNRSIRNGYQVVFVPFRNGEPVSGPVPFLTGFVTDPTGATVNGRPVGVAVSSDGSLLVSDDGGNVIWRISKM